MALDFRTINTGKQYSEVSYLRLACHFLDDPFLMDLSGLTWNVLTSCRCKVPTNHCLSVFPVGVNQSFLLNTSSYLASIHGVSKFNVSPSRRFLLTCKGSTNKYIVGIA